MFPAYRKVLQIKEVQYCVCTRFIRTTLKMAKSKFEYVKSFETEDRLEPGHWIIIALRYFNLQQIVDNHVLERPNDKRLIHLMENSAKSVMSEFKEVQLCYCFGDELSLVFANNTTLYRRRGPKLLTNLCSLMASSFVSLWPDYFKSVILKFTPVIEGTVYLFPNDQCLRDYMMQRQLTCHYRNLYETVLWALVRTANVTLSEASDILKGTSEGEKNEILFSRCNRNYNKEEDVYKKGSVIVRKLVPTEVVTPEGAIKLRNQSQLIVLNTDFVKDSFWENVFPVAKNTKQCNKTNYLKDMEKKAKLLPHTWIVVRIDGKGFHKFSEKHNFTKPNDLRSIELMNRAAIAVMEEYNDIVLSYGQSDEYTFVIGRYSKMMERNGNRIMSSVVSLFAATYVYHWSEIFRDVELKYPPAFDARVILYPNNSCLRDCLSWRQADCHINNMYNLCFWTLIQAGNLSHQKAEERLCGTFSKDKRDILLKDFDIDYDKEDAIYRKGTILYRDGPKDLSVKVSPVDVRLVASHSSSVVSQDLNNDCSGGSTIITVHMDMINDGFWVERPWILGTERDARTLADLDD